MPLPAETLPIPILPDTIIPSEGILEGDKTRYPWKDVPLIESGLLGPVKVEVITFLRN
jgi:hypothetical protein